MSNIIRFKNFKNKTKPFPTNGMDKVYSLYHELIDSGFSSCVAYHEAMRLLLYCNPKLELSDLSQKTFEIINPVFDNYFCLLYTSPSPRDSDSSRMPSSA